MNIAVVGCGYVAESYVKTLVNYPDLKLIGAFDRDRSNLDAFCRRWKVPAFETRRLGAARSGAMAFP